MARNIQETAGELERLIQLAGESAGALVTTYEPIEAAYRQAAAWNGPVSEVMNTSTVPRALVTTATSAR
jgi:hypothetical protein